MPTTSPSRLNNLSPEVQEVMPTVRPPLPALFKKCLGGKQQASPEPLPFPQHPTPQKWSLGDGKSGPPHPNLGRFCRDLPASDLPLGLSGPSFRTALQLNFSLCTVTPFLSIGVDIKSTTYQPLRRLISTQSQLPWSSTAKNLLSNP